MGYQLDVELRETYLYLSLTGDYDPDQALRDFGRLLDACTESGLSKVVIDIRDLRNNIVNIIDRYEYIKAVNKQYVDYRKRGGGILRIAYVASGEIFTLQDNFNETVAENFGFPAIETSDFDEALRWLDQ
jgi:hypothetical protein